MIETVFQWLAAYPGLEGLTLERLDAAPGSAGLFCKGRQVLWRREDILGKGTVRQRLAFALEIHRTGAGGPQEFLDLAQWATATAPRLGMDQTVSLEKGCLDKAGPNGTARYGATITFEFTSEV